MARKKKTTVETNEAPRPKPVIKESMFPTDKLIKEMQNQICDLFDANAVDISNAYQQANEFHDVDKKFNYKISATFSISGKDPQSYEVETKISFAVKQSDQRDNEVRSESDLVDQMGNEDDAE